MKNIHFILFVFAWLGLNSCAKEAALPTVDEITVQAFLHAGQPLDTVTFGRVIPLDSLEAEIAPDDLLPVVKTETGESFPLYFLGETGKYGNPDLLIEGDKAYSLELDYNGQTITAETYVPTAPQNVTLTDTLIERAKITDFTDLQNQTIPDPIQVDWAGEVGAWYFVHVRNMEDDPEPVNELFSGGGGNFQRPDFLTEPSTNPFYLIDVFRDITHYGQYEVIVYRVNPEYVALYEDNTEGSGSLNEIRTNVQNGFGIFTGVNSARVFFEVKKS